MQPIAPKVATGCAFCYLTALRTDGKISITLWSDFGLTSGLNPRDHNLMNYKFYALDNFKFIDIQFQKCYLLNCSYYSPLPGSLSKQALLSLTYKTHTTSCKWCKWNTNVMYFLPSFMLHFIYIHQIANKTR